MKTLVLCTLQRFRGSRSDKGDPTNHNCRATNLVVLTRLVFLVLQEVFLVLVTMVVTTRMQFFISKFNLIINNY